MAATNYKLQVDNAFSDATLIYLKFKKKQEIVFKYLIHYTDIIDMWFKKCIIFLFKTFILYFYTS